MTKPTHAVESSVTPSSVTPLSLPSAIQVGDKLVLSTADGAWIRDYPDGEWEPLDPALRPEKPETGASDQG